MKKKNSFLFVSVVIFSISLFGKVNRENKMRVLILENVEALAENEPITGYEGEKVAYLWNETNWWGDKTKSSLLDFFPTYDYCRNDGKDGHQVYCSAGDGNCWNGTDCIPD